MTSSTPLTALEVRFGARVVGSLRAHDDGRSSFTYDPRWLARADRFPISVTIPLVPEPLLGGAAQAFFGNLLPEGAARTAVCARLGISPDNDFGLLRAIGGECAGALSLVDPAAPPPDPDDYAYEELRPARLQKLLADATPLLVGGATTRLSLAGAQDKLPVALLDGKLHLPLAGAPSSHILKLPNPRYTHLVVNECFGLFLARRIGLDVAAAELLDATDPPSLLVERYDRVTTADPIRRLHQEDLCQATGLPSTRKYEDEGGPSFAQIAAVIRAHVTRPLVDVPRLVQWQAYNVVLGNSDGHAKNLSILYADDAIRLAPFYDLVSTRAYKGLHRNLALRIGGRQNPDEIGRADWRAASADLDIGERVVGELVRGVAERVIAELPATKHAFRETYGAHPVLQTLPAAIAARARRVVRALR